MRLKTKFSLLISLLVVIIVLGVTIFLLIAESRFLIKEMEKSRTKMIESLAQVAKESLIVKDDILLLNYLKLIKNTNGLVYALVTDTSNNVIAHTDLNFLGDKLTDDISLKAKKTDGLLIQKYDMDKATPILDLAFPVYVDDKNTGIARIGFSQIALNKAVQEALAVTRRRIFMVAVAALIVGLLGAVILTGMMTGPINKIAQGAQIIGQGKLDHQIAVKSKDELGDLAAEFNKMSDKLKELDQMKSDFVSSVTHELRSPLLSLRMYIDLFNKGAAGEVNDKQKEYLQVMKDGAFRLSRFIDDLLDMAKIERGKMEVTLQSTDLSPVIKETAQLFEPQVNQKKIKLNVVMPEKLPRVTADSVRTQQVLTNLLSNAVKFTPEGGTIAIEARKNDSTKMLEISVSDTGMGIPKDQLNSIFNKFEQVKGARKNVSGPKGTGLGLAIIKGLMEAQGGTIWVESELNKGSKFTFNLPLIG
ncbi:MAG: HAMP domain-containing histidine kinase [Endomicrobiales bacterium]|nr:HAMP domain-containing histidine kinase [Endomicrobiales bacterium]